VPSGDGREDRDNARNERRGGEDPQSASRVIDTRCQLDEPFVLRELCLSDAACRSEQEDVAPEGQSDKIVLLVELA
jgi:hypothetical protein